MSGRAACITVGLLAAAAGPVRAEGVELWTEAGVQYEVTDELQVAFDQHLRFDEDVSRVMAVMSEPQVSYRWFKWLRTGVGYRYQYERNNSGELVSRHRLQLDVRFRYDLHDFRLGYQPQFEVEVRPTSSDEYRHRIRQDFSVAYRGIRPLVPAVNVELFHPLWDFGETIHLEKIRLTAGLSYEWGRHAVEAFYRVELVQDLPDVPTRHIIGVGYHVDLSPAKAKKPKKPKDGKGGKGGKDGKGGKGDKDGVDEKDGVGVKDGDAPVDPEPEPEPTVPTEPTPDR